MLHKFRNMDQLNLQQIAQFQENFFFAQNQIHRRLYQSSFCLL